ncbi:cytochrome P450 monooxygenase-like protein 12 [Elsinoe australis]|uniref:Cytochrome P450 monooxygenase-like protein 12 n=1 Tax=Elsinoe australis TaxID=40998 RepID=A0A4U7B3K6_9PEZI|nr:cytochrome P450 monooxygenase-like protein 12 [Elsinoe australis]
MHPLVVIIILLIPVAYYIHLFLDAYRKRKNDPHELPGPTLFPYIGRIHDLPIDYMWVKFREWADIYGPIYRTEMLGTKFVIVSDEKIIEELLVKRAKYNSDRPGVKSLFDSKSTYGSMEYLPLMGHNQYWARGRKLTHSYLTQGTNAQYYGFMDYEVKRWMYRLLTEPETFQYTLEDMAAKIMCHLVWDDHVHSTKLIPSAWGLLTQMSPAGPITNILTPLWDLPLFLNPWKRAEHKRHDTQQAFWLERLEQVRRETAEGLTRPSFTRQYLEMADKAPLSGDHEASSCLGMLAIVGVFTIGGPLNYFLLSMLYHPAAQLRCQQEMLQVLGDRPPTLSDMPRLPFLRACIRETMRWKPNVPTGVAHETERDDYYNGYFIAKGSRILPLDCALLRNPKKYPDPDNFRPERWVEPGWPTYQEPLTQYPTIKGMTSFGWGQRQCLGMSLTQDELFIACGNLLYYFDLKKAVGRDGKEINPDPEKSNSLLIIKPDKFEMRFEVRGEEKRRAIVERWETAEKEFEGRREEFRGRGRKEREELREKVERVVEEKARTVKVTEVEVVDVVDVVV